jgi:3',5'-cyclic-nucleotide phosphodiesterase/cAMP-specific phosphodiesterase 4
MRSLEDHIDVTIDLEGIGEWNFDTLQFSEKTRKEPILEMGRHIFSHLDLLETFSINEFNLSEFLRGIESMYSRNNYYHSNIHGADVTNSVLFLLQNGLLMRGALAEIEILALIVSAICHDVAHPGVNNAYLVATQDKLAMKYNDNSVLENMHAAMTFRVLQRPNSNIVGTLVHDDWVTFRKFVVALILSTDLQRHFEIVTEFKNLNESENGVLMTEDSHRMLALELAIKCADIAHGAKRLEIHKKWTGHVTKEFFAQGDKEKKLGIPVSPLCDRETVVIANSQKGFLSFLVLPIFEQWEAFVSFGMDADDEEVEPYLLPVKMIKENLEFWEEECKDQTFYLDHSPPPALMRMKITTKRLPMIATQEPMTS